MRTSLIDLYSGVYVFATNTCLYGQAQKVVWWCLLLPEVVNLGIFDRELDAATISIFLLVFFRGVGLGIGDQNVRCG